MSIDLILTALTGNFETDLARARKVSKRAFNEIKRDAAKVNKRLRKLLKGQI